jgi:hypothetical protein
MGNVFVPRKSGINSPPKALDGLAPAITSQQVVSHYSRSRHFALILIEFLQQNALYIPHNILQPFPSLHADRIPSLIDFYT